MRESSEADINQGFYWKMFRNGKKTYINSGFKNSRLSTRVGVFNWADALRSERIRMDDKGEDILVKKNRKKDLSAAVIDQ